MKGQWRMVQAYSFFCSQKKMTPVYTGVISKTYCNRDTKLNMYEIIDADLCAWD